MNNLLKADFYKLGKNTTLKICFIISCICILLLAFILHGVAAGTIGSEVSGASSLLVDAMMSSLLASLVIGNLVCGDFESKTIHDEIACGEGRWSVVLTKTITCMIIIGLIILPYAVTALVCYFGKIDIAPMAGIPSVFINIMCNSAAVELSGSAVVKSIVICLVAIVAYMARLSLCIPLAFKVKMPVFVMAFGIISSFGFDMIIQAVKDVDVVSTIMNNTPFALIYDLTMDAGAGTIVKVLVLSIIFIVLVTMLTYALFRKSDIK